MSGTTNQIELEECDKVDKATKVAIEDGCGDTEVWYHVNKRLLPVKCVYFTFISALGSLIPFIPLYMKQLGLSTTETGLLFGVIPFITFVVQPLFGVIADKTRKHKVVVIICLIFSGIFFGLLIVPEKFLVKICNNQPHSFLVGCGNNEIYFFDNQCVFKNITTIINTSTVSEMFLTFDQLQNSCGLPDRQLDNISKSKNNANTLVDNCTKSNCQLLHGFHAARFEIVNDPNEHIFQNQHTEFSNVSQIHSSKRATVLHKLHWNATCENDTYDVCSLECNSVKYADCVSDGSKLFWIFSGIYVLGNIFLTPVVSLVDAMAYNIFGNKRDLYGRQRLWGTIGFAVFSMTTSFIRDRTTRSDNSVDYSSSFYIFSGLCVISSIVVTTLDVSEALHCQRMLHNVTALLCLPKIIGFLLVVTYLGMMQAVWLGFFFWYLEDIGSNQIVIGLCCVINAASEVFFLSVSGKIIQLIGHVQCLYIALLGFSVRYASFSFLTNAWHVLPVELLHGVCLGLMYAAATAYASIISPEGMTATVQGLMAGLYFGFGRGIIFFVTGKLFDPISGLGGRWTFRLYSIVSLFILIVYAITNMVVSRYSRRTEKSAVTDTEKEHSDAEHPLPDEPFLKRKIQNS